MQPARNTGMDHMVLSGTLTEAIVLVSFKDVSG
jgi:hypothetical protein